MTNRFPVDNSNSGKIPPPSFVKIAMRNMVRKGSQSLIHFGFTAFGFIGFILLLAYFARPHLPS